MDMNLNKIMDTVEDREAWRAAIQGVTTLRHNLETEEQQQQFR